VLWHASFSFKKSLQVGLLLGNHGFYERGDVRGTYASCQVVPVHSKESVCRHLLERQRRQLALGIAIVTDSNVWNDARSWLRSRS
jgi:hypothetical protein